VTDPRELYQEVIIEHNKKPRNYGDLEPCTHQAHGLNPLCGDDIVLKVVVADGIVQDIRFLGQGCAISKASSSLMTVNVKGKPLAEAELMVEQFRSMIRGTLDTAVDPNILGKLSLFQSVKNLPSRVKCAVLPWATLHSALHGEEIVSTE
jgi:nitrogen fixation protein NifU and related proteins